MKRSPKPLREKREGCEGAAQASTGAVSRSLSRYTVHNLDAAIAHLEMAIAVDDTMSIFSRRYWCGRVIEVRSTPGILHLQVRRLELLLDRVEGAVAPAREFKKTLEVV